MLNALRFLTVILLLQAPTAHAAEKSLSKSISDGWESVVKDASKAAKTVTKAATKAANEAVSPKKAKRKKSAKKDEDAPPKNTAKSKTSGPPQQTKRDKPDADDEGPPVPLATAPAADRTPPPELKKEATPARRLPPPPEIKSTKATRDDPNAPPAPSGKRGGDVPQADIVPLRRDNKEAEAPPSAQPGKPLPITMIPPKSAEPAANANTWSKEEIDAAKANCAAILKSVDAVTIPEAPVREGNCGAPAPVRLVSIGKNPEVALSPPPLVTCELVAGLHQWMKNDIQPLSRKYFSAPVIKIETMSDYSCRMAYGRKGNKLSEHGKANALDIRGFITSKGGAAYVLEEWGKTERDRVAEAAAAAARKTAAESAESAAAVAGSKSAVEGQTKVATASLNATAAKPPAKPDAEKAAAAVIVPEAPRSTKSQFLHDAHTSACRIFGTSLGPESNEAHRNHFHVDMAERKHTKICE